MGFSDEQVLRYSRHILLKGVGGKGQKKLLDSRVLVIGAGGLGSPITLYLAAAGVGTLGIVDDDAVELSNLQRQIAHHTADIGRPKVESAGTTARAINPDVTVVPHHHRIHSENIRDIIRDYDFIVEGTDNFPTKFLVNDACVFEDKPFSIGGVLRFQGNTMTHVPGSACYRCTFPAPPPAGLVPTCAEAGVFGSVVGMIGTVQATETLKYLLGVGDLLTDRLLTMDALEMEWRTIHVRRDDDCPICGTSPTIRELIEEEQVACGVPDAEVPRVEASAEEAFAEEASVEKNTLADAHRTIRETVVRR